MPMARQTRADDSAFEDVQRGKQRGRAVTFVVVGHRAGPAGLHRQAGLGSLQRLDLALFVDTEDQGLVGRVDIQADDVGELLDEPRVGRQFERPDAVRLQSMSVPNAMESRPGSALARRPSSADSSGWPEAAWCAAWRLRLAARELR